MRVCRHVISVRTRAERVKQQLEPVWPATNMAAGRPSMSHGETRSHHINLTRQRRRLFLQFLTQSQGTACRFYILLSNVGELLWILRFSCIPNCNDNTARFRVVKCFLCQFCFCFQIILFCGHHLLVWYLLWWRRFSVLFFTSPKFSLHYSPPQCPVCRVIMWGTRIGRRQCQVLWILQIPPQQIGKCTLIFLSYSTDGMSFDTLNHNFTHH